MAMSLLPKVTIGARSLRFERFRVLRGRDLRRKRDFLEERLLDREAERSLRVRKLKSRPSFNLKEKIIKFPSHARLGKGNNLKILNN